ncbi:MAG: hypothetical protein EBS38_02670 [Actinobacteria bacterium]|nr:hypothetical protein [Actinomycetota bacterium]
MSEVITKLVIDCETGEQHIVPLTEEELEEREQMRVQAEAERAAREAEEAARLAAKASAEAKLKALGLTNAEVAALLG